ncbi:MAG: helix-turn-helix domain-containing protein [bacterium]|nr:helix-turn-helix domain-containing protein [bacterium]
MKSSTEHTTPSTQTTVDDRPFLSAQQAADLIQVELSTLYAYTSRREIPHIKRGGKLYFDREVLIQWVREGTRNVVDAHTASRHTAAHKGGAR